MYCRKCGKEISTGNVCNSCGFDNIQQKYVNIASNVRGLQQFNTTSNENTNKNNTNNSAASKVKRNTYETSSDATRGINTPNKRNEPNRKNINLKKSSKKNHLALIIGVILFVVVALVGVGTFGYMYFFGSIKDKRDCSQLLKYIEENKFDEAEDYYKDELSKTANKKILNKFVSDVASKYDGILEDYNTGKIEDKSVTAVMGIMIDILAKDGSWDDDYQTFTENYRILFDSKKNFASATKLMENGDYENAIRKLIIVNKKDTNYKQVNDKIKESITKLSEKSEDYTKVYNILQEAENSLSNEDYNSIKSNIDKAVVENANEKVQSYIQNNNITEAKKFLEGVIKKYPDLTELNDKLNTIESDYIKKTKEEAKKYFDAKDYGKAVSCLKVAISQVGKDNTELNNLLKEYKSYMDTYLEDMDDLNHDGYISSGTIKDNTGVSHDHGVDIYGEYFSYLLNGKYNTFSGKMALNYAKRDTDCNYWYEIYGDEALLYTSPKFTAEVLPVDFSVDISNVNVLRIVVKGQYETGNRYVHQNTIFLYDAILKRNN